MEGFYLLLRELFFMLGYVKSPSNFPKPLDPRQEEALIQKMVQGDREAKQKLIEHNLRLVVHIAKKYAQNRDMDDLVSCGTIGLIKGVSTYDPAKGVQLVTYASRCIQNEILMRIRSEKKERREVSLSEPIGADSEGNELTLLDILCTQEESVDETVIRNTRLSRIRNLVAKLEPRQSTIMTLRYGLEDGNAMTQNEVAEVLGISRSYVSRIEKKAMQKLAAMLEH
ncbi:MAG: RNA polymerase sporulation sigma factor SigK [Clostridia bacterium]|nr:RNA polymerase sporulation sigma factor SigK [Clostridia bacterium]